ncbi:MAG: hypothetical protein JWP09_457 [Candidatus Taylorbacteria bacterium]|nr:hypothetical protein [Candidatus Taylorbacteria bacterium]
MRDIPTEAERMVMETPEESAETASTEANSEQVTDAPEDSKEKIESDKEGVEGLGGKAEAEKSQEAFEQKKAESEKESKEKANEIREELQHAGEEVDAKKEEASAKIGDLITETQNKKIEVISRIENEVHFKKAFPFLSIFNFFGMARTTAKTFYAEEYRAKVDVKEAQDENTMSRLNDRESRLQELINAAGNETDLDKLEAILGQLKSLSEADNVDKKALEETDPKNEEVVVKDQPKKSDEGNQGQKTQS